MRRAPALLVSLGPRRPRHPRTEQGKSEIPARHRHLETPSPCRRQHSRSAPGALPSMRDPVKSKRHIELFVLIDALGWEYLERNDFLTDVLPHRNPLRTILGFSSGAI